MANVNPYLFVVGCPRSGTTVLRRMVNAHPQVAIPSAEQHWIVACGMKRTGLTPHGEVTSELISMLNADDDFADLGIDREQLEHLADPRKPPSYASFVSRVLDLYGSTQGKALVGDKTPGAVRGLPTLHELWPSAKVVHLIRDGRDVSLSAVNWRRANKLARRFPTWTEDPMGSAALWWEWHVRLGREAASFLGPHLYHEVYYEDLVGDPERELQHLCAFLELRYDDAMLRFHEGRQRIDPGLSAKRAWLPPTPGLRDWKTQMAAEDIDRFETIAGDLLGELGYARTAAADHDPELHDLAAELRDAFIAAQLTRGRRLPAHWLPQERRVAATGLQQERSRVGRT